MGYCYEGRRLSCDSCDEADGTVRKRVCPHKVPQASSQGLQAGLPYCQAPALCTACFKKLGGIRGVHGECATAAAKRVAEEFEKQRRFDAGCWERSTAYGDWHEAVPQGMVGVVFRRGAERQAFLIADEDYGKFDWLEDFPAAMLTPWPGCPGGQTKEVRL